MKKTALESFVITIMTYCAFCYVIWEIDPEKWTSSVRAGFIFISCGFSVIYQLVKRVD